ncbi:MAG: DUF4468 domain-containing protein [Desulfobacteraceae bacterium]|nr:DUF4468 domain-containing protein [Desulfobacteraceae bacterium]
MIKQFFLFISLFLVGCAGLQPVTDTNRIFQRVIQAPGYSKEQIFNGTKIWIAENFNSAKAVIEYENKDDWTIIGNGIIPYPCTGFDCVAKMNWKVPFTMRVDIKDQKFRLTFSNIHLSWPPSYNATFGAQPGYNGPVRTQGDLDAIKPKFLKFGDALLASFKTNRQKSDW